jgi:hypothetical protein
MKLEFMRIIPGRLALNHGARAAFRADSTVTQQPSWNEPACIPQSVRSLARGCTAPAGHGVSLPVDAESRAELRVFRALAEQAAETAVLCAFRAVNWQQSGTPPRGVKSTRAL